MESVKESNSSTEEFDSGSEMEQETAEDITLISVISEKEFVSYLISLYREHTELWDTTCIYYRDSRKRAAALKKITETLQIYKPEFTEYILRKKINVLRTNFNKERKRVEKGIISSPGLWYWQDLQFLNLNKGSDLTSETEPDKSEELVTVKSDLHEYQRTPKLQPKKRKAQPKKDESSMFFSPTSSTPISQDKPEQEESDVIAKGWLIKLKRLSSDQRTYAEKIIQDVLFEGEMGTLTRNRVMAIQDALSQCTEML